MLIKINDVEVKVLINYKNIKNIIYRFNEKNELVVSSPFNMKEKEVIKSIKEKESELYKLYLKQKELNEYNNKFFYLGKECIVKYHPSLEKVGFKDNYVYTKDDKMLETFWKSECLKVFTGEIDICKKCFSSIPDFKLKVRKMKTRWGVCNLKNNTITLNSDLLKKDLDVIDYVIIHEMCHFYEPNHSKKFWELVGQACPNYKELKKRLKNRYKKH